MTMETDMIQVVSSWGEPFLCTFYERCVRYRCYIIILVDSTTEKSYDSNAYIGLIALSQLDSEVKDNKTEAFRCNYSFKSF